MLSKFDYQAPPVGEMYGDPDGVTFTVVQYESVAHQGTDAVPSVLVRKRCPGEASAEDHRHVTVEQWEQFVMQHCLMRLHIVDDSSASVTVPAGKQRAFLPRLYAASQSLRLTADTFACYLAGQFIALRNRGA